MDFSALVGHQDMLSPGSPEVALLRADAVQLLTQLDEREGLHTQKVVPLPAGMWNAFYRLSPCPVSYPGGARVHLSNHTPQPRLLAQIKLPLPKPVKR